MMHVIDEAAHERGLRHAEQSIRGAHIGCVIDEAAHERGLRLQRFHVFVVPVLRHR